MSVCRLNYFGLLVITASTIALQAISMGSTPIESTILIKNKTIMCWYTNRCLEQKVAKEETRMMSEILSHCIS